MKREDFIATIGFQGNTAFVDAKVRKRFGKLSAIELLERGAYRPAFCAALYDGDDEAIKKLIEHFRDQAGEEYETEADLKRMFGVDSVPDDVQRVKAL